MLVMSASMFVFLVFVNRYILGTFLRRTRREQFESSGASYEPQVTVVVPMYNEGSGISDTILSIVNQAYPAEKLDLIVVDDCSRDDSGQLAWRAAQLSHRHVRIFKNEVNVGKRISILSAVRRTSAEI